MKADLLFVSDTENERVALTISAVRVAVTDAVPLRDALFVMLTEIVLLGVFLVPVCS